ncbi:MAG: MFS transporter [Defluviicoccus sp.]
MCLAEVLTMTGVFAFPALLPSFVLEWSLTNAEAGWIAGISFVAYAVGAPPLLTATDRIDARRIYVGGALVTALSSAGFAWLATGFASGLVFRLLAGLGLAATYMPGLKVLVDRYRGERQSRAVALYTSSFSLGTAASFFLAGEVTALLGWRATFAAAAIAAVSAALVVLRLPAVRPAATAAPGRLAGLRAVFANRGAMAYVLAYGAHCWELFVWRSWMVAFLTFGIGALGLAHAPWPAPTTVATVSGLVAMAASIAGNELAERLGRKRAVAGIMAGSAACALSIGLAPGWSYPVLVTASLVYTAVIMLDSATLTAGAVAVAQHERRGATMAVHAAIGFGCAGIGPVVFGLVLDQAGGSGDASAWWVAFATMALAGLVGPLALTLGRPRERVNRDAG